MKHRLTALLLVLLCLPLTACQKQQKLYSATWFDLFDTVAIVQGYADSQDSWNAQTQAMYSDLQRYNELFDIYHHYDGVINLYDVNARAAAAPVQVSDELYAFLRWCKDTAYPAANGATNIAAGAVLRLWHDARESDSPAPPDADAIAAALAHIDIEDLVLDDAAQTVYFADPEMALDVGAVGKGYAVEQTARAAQDRGLTSALLNIGGSIPYLVTQFFGGTSLLILVGVLLDMMRQVETTLLSRNYDGFLKKGKLKGKYGHVQGTGSAAGSRTVAAMWIVIAVLVLAGAVAYNAMH